MCLFQKDDERNCIISNDNNTHNSALNNIKCFNLDDYREYKINTLEKANNNEYFVPVGNTSRAAHDSYIISKLGRVYRLKSSVLFKTSDRKSLESIVHLNGLQYSVHRLLCSIFEGHIPPEKIVYRSGDIQSGSLVDELALSNKPRDLKDVVNLRYILFVKAIEDSGTSKYSPLLNTDNI